MRPLRAIALLLGGALVLLGLYVFLGKGEPVSEQVEGAPVPEPLAVDRRPVREPHAAPRVDGLAGVEARWVRLNNEATLLLADEELERAVEMFEQCYAAEPERNVFRKNLAEALVRLARARHDERRIPDAVGYLARAIELVPERDDVETLRSILARWREESALEANHWTDESDLFELSYDTNRDDILQNSQDVLDHLERAYEDLRQWFGRDPVREDGRERIRVVAYNRDEFDRLTGLGDWAGGVFDGVVRLAVEDLAAEETRWTRVLTHELVHAFIHEIGGPTVPGWLNEGLSQLLEEGPHPLDEARRRLEGAPLYPLERLQGSLASWEDRDEIARAYAQSLLLVARIQRDYGDEALRRMVAECAEGREPAVSFEAYAQVPLAFVLERLLE